MTPPMRKARWLVPLLMVAAVFFAAREARRERAAERASVAAVRERAAASEALQAARAKLADAEAAKAAKAAAAAVSDGKAAAEADAKRSVDMKIQRSPADPRILEATDPRLRALHLESYAADFDGDWGPLLKRLNLSPEKLERFKAILLAHETKRLDVTAVAGEQKLSLGDPAIQQLRSADGGVLVREMKALLAPDEFAAYQQYRHDFDLRPLINEVATQTYFTTAPLTLEQSQRLQEILSANSEKRSNNFVVAGTVNWEEAMKQIEATGAFPAATLEVLQRTAAVHAAENRFMKTWQEISQKVAGKPVPGVWLPDVSLRP